MTGDFPFLDRFSIPWMNYVATSQRNIAEGNWSAVAIPKCIQIHLLYPHPPYSLEYHSLTTSRIIIIVPSYFHDVFNIFPVHSLHVPFIFPRFSYPMFFLFHFIIIPCIFPCFSRHFPMVFPFPIFFLPFSQVFPRVFPIFGVPHD